ncbi:dienelactone hydrolase family protein [Sphingomonas immobilis]|uniref:Dienelactone hydrolase family protein n=1 Tax=Sphingomonas immobilis TaxID=3063997 RepID=A0ABT9A104_9SPHN|nr:dienelactone hydrolase family protein [Sphingomonas sp. CA1-15]MDO7842377.1 dienelactone hydrolase family protein [Sphingomonas sp. CA1-15]
MPQEQVTIKTADGDCNTYVLTPSEGAGPWPAVIVYMDALAIRPAMIDMARRLADAGYVALLPDLFYRYGPHETLDPKAVFAQGFGNSIVPTLMASTDNHKAAEDTRALLAYLDTRSDVAGEKVGTVGFCMGGGMALTAAGFFPERVAAAASYHGGNIATDKPTSPHLLAPKMKAEVYVAGADKDDSYPPEQAERMEKALTDAGVKHVAEIYEGAAHGWMKTDFPIYNKDAAERGWREMLALFDRNLH